MRQLLILATSIFFIGYFAACSKSSNDTSDNTTTGQALCAPGSTMSAGGCTPYQTVPGITGPISYLADVHNPVGQGTNSYTLSNYDYFLKNLMQVCDQGSWYNIGTSDCSSWVGGYNSIMINVNSSSDNTVGVEFRSKPQASYISGSGGVISPGIGQNPLGLSMNVFPTNNNAGFVLQNYGSNYNIGWNKKVAVQIASGHFGDQYLDFQVIVFKSSNDTTGTVVSSGRAYACTTARCGM